MPPEYDEDMQADGEEYAEELRRARLRELVDEDGNELFDFGEDDE